MPKSRTSSIGSRSGDSGFDEEEMSRRIEDRMNGVEIDVQLPSRSRGGMENLRVSFQDGNASVHSASGNTYHVDIENEICDCPDHVNRQSRCRHIEATSIAQGRIAEGFVTGNTTDSIVNTNQVAAEYLNNESNSEVSLGRREYQDDGFFYSDNTAQFNSDAERLLRQPLPYYYENVLNGADTTFGIELEFVHGNSDAIARELHTMGICGNDSMSNYHGRRTPGKWTLERDCSVTSGGRGGELISPILTDTPETWRNLEAVCEVARRHGAEVNFKTGGHIHVGAEDSLDGKRQRWRRFFKMCSGFEDVFHKLAGGEQGIFRGIHDSHYTQSARTQSHSGLSARMPDEADINTYKRIISGIGEDKYRSINLLPFSEKKTIEFRAFNGTLTPAVIQANVKYAVGFINAAERSRTRDNESFSVSDHDKRRGEIINGYASMENNQSDNAIIKVLDTVCSRKEDKEHLLAVMVRNRWDR